MARKPKYINVDAMREIKKTRSRFFSLFLLSALAVAFLAGEGASFITGQGLTCDGGFVS